MEMKVEAGEGAGALLVGPELGWPEVVVETRLRAAVMAGCEGSFRLEVEEASCAGETAAADEGNLPRPRKHHKLRWYFLQLSKWYFLKLSF